MDYLDNIMNEFFKILPILMLSVYHFLVTSLPFLMLLFGVIYLLLQISYLIWKWRRESKSEVKDSINIQKGDK